MNFTATPAAMRAGGDDDDDSAAQGCFAPVYIDTPSVSDREPLAASLVDDDDEFDEHSAVAARVILRTLIHDLSSRDRALSAATEADVAS